MSTRLAYNLTPKDRPSAAQNLGLSAPGSCVYWSNPRRVAGLALLSCTGLLGCGGAPSSRATSPSSAKSEGQQCLADARESRTPRADAPGKISAKQILIRHAELKDPHGATRTPEQACLRALAALNALTSGDKGWDDVVQQFSDSKSDDLGRVAYDELSPAFANAAFSLDVDELSYVVESDRGFHVILRTQ